MSLRALVVGATGFLGSVLCDQLRADGHDVVAGVRASSDTSELDRRSIAARTLPSLHGADAQDELDDFAASIAPDETYVTVAAREGDLSTLLEANVRLPSMLAASLATCTSSVLVHAASWHARPGTVPPSDYAATRAAADPILEHLVRSRSLRAAWLSIGSMYGAGDRRRKVLPMLVEAVVSGAPIDLVDPARVVDLVHVADVARAMRAVARGLHDHSIDPGDRLDACSGDQVTLAEVVALVERAAGRTIDARWNARPRSTSDDVDPPAELMMPPDWQPDVALADGIAELVHAHPLAPIPITRT